MVGNRIIPGWVLVAETWEFIHEIQTSSIEGWKDKFFSWFYLKDSVKIQTFANIFCRPSHYSAQYFPAMDDKENKDFWK